MSDMRGTQLTEEMLSSYTTWRIGGPAQLLYKPADIADLQTFIKTRPQNESITWLGLGSNALIRDGGIPGTVILTQGCLSGLELVGDNLIRAEAGVSCAKMARFTARANLHGGEFWAGIPGTMGGALRMNAGCFQGETWDSVIEVETMTKSGEIRKRRPEEFQIAYRSVAGLDEDEWFIASTCKLAPGDKAEALTRIKTLLQRRTETQPTSDYNCGSVFRNPPGHYAAQLIESCGLKGFMMGGAMVSPKHANFIINHEGRAKASDIENLIQHIHETVLAQKGISLHREVHILGEQHACQK